MNVCVCVCVQYTTDLNAFNRIDVYSKRVLIMQKFIGIYLAGKSRRFNKLSSKIVICESKGKSFIVTMVYLHFISIFTINVMEIVLPVQDLLVFFSVICKKQREIIIKEAAVIFLSM